MRRFAIYLIKEEFCLHFYGNEVKLFDLFLDYERNVNIDHEIVKRQVDYITRPIPSLMIQQMIEEELANSPSYYSLWNGHYLEMENSQASLSVHDKFLLLRSKGSYHCETTFFEILRKCDPYFLAMDFDTQQYGWLNPIKQRNLV